MISAVILTKNEEKNIKDCLECLKWCNEIIVVDDQSVDETVKIAKKEGAKVFSRPLNGDFANQRNFGMEEASGDWIFFVDADERVTLKLTDEMVSKIKELEKSNQDNINGFYFKRADFFINRWLKHGETGSVRILRLARKGAGKWERKVDEIWKVDGNTEEFDNPLFHYSHPNLDQFLESINERSTLNAQELFEKGINNTCCDWYKPLGKFIVNYFFRMGFLDGVNGFVFAVLMSFHSFLVRGKLYLLWKRKEKQG